MSDARRPPGRRFEATLVRVVLAGAALAALLYALRSHGPPGAGGEPPVHSVSTDASRLFICVWNVESLFDDRDDPGLVDDIEDWMGRVPGVAAQKCRRLAEALRQLNVGRGPDVIGLVEGENREAVDALRVELNRGLVGSDRYEYVVHRDNRRGRRIEPAVLSRVPIVEGSSQFGSRRIIHAVITPDGRPLHLLLSHWTSRATPNSDRQRKGYAETLRAEMDRLRARDPSIDLLIAGDFNQDPDSELVESVLGADRPPPPIGPVPAGEVVNLMLGIAPDRRSTDVYMRRTQTSDQILATSGLFDGRGWRVVPGSAAVVDEPRLRLRGATPPTPWRFGGRDHKGPRGFSDHFAVTVVVEHVDGPSGAAMPPAR